MAFDGEAGGDIDPANGAVLWWMRGVIDEVLLPLHEVHPLRRVEFAEDRGRAASSVGGYFLAGDPEPAQEPCPKRAGRNRVRPVSLLRMFLRPLPPSGLRVWMVTDAPQSS